jgi:hypothetical protein
MRARYEHALAEVLEMKRALAERARHVAELEQQLMRQVEEGARGSTRESAREGRKPRRATPDPTESDLARAVAAAEAEKALAHAEREKLDERERNIRRVERELAGLRVQLEKSRGATGSDPAAPPPSEPQPDKEPPPPTPLLQPPSEPELEPAATSRRRTTKRR